MGIYAGLPPRPYGPRGYAAVGWILAIIGALIMIGMHQLEAVFGEETEDDSAGVDVLMIELQGKVMLGGVALQGGQPGMLYNSANQSLNLGSVPQRQRFAVLAAELAGPETAKDVLNEIDEHVAEAVAESDEKIDTPIGQLVEVEGVITGRQSAVQHVLHKIYDVEEGAADAGDWAQLRDNIDALNDDERELVRTELGWFGELALAPRATDVFSDPLKDSPQRREIINRARLMMIILVVLFIGLGFLGLCGFIGLIVLLALLLSRRVRTGFGPGMVHHGIYAETFGIWMFTFPLLQAAAGFAKFISAGLVMPAVVFMFFASLVTLAWPVIRGARWSDVRADIGWTFGRNPLAQPMFGVAGYAMALPMLAVGIAITFVLMQVQLALSPEQHPLAPAGGPAHPVFIQLSGPDLWPKLLILFLAAVAAPIVEETMFRGVLYRHLRDATHQLGFILSVLVSGGLNAFLFAAIHPQGWVAIPALMSLALAFVLLREWRGSVVPAICVHAISNFIVMSMVILMVSM